MKKMLFLAHKEKKLFLAEPGKSVHFKSSDPTQHLMFQKVGHLSGKKSTITHQCEIIKK